MNKKVNISNNQMIILNNYIELTLKNEMSEKLIPKLHLEIHLKTVS